MHTSLSKKLLAGLLSLVMVLSLVAPSTSAQAATKYSLTDKKSVKSGVTFKYELKGVSKGCYVKVTRNVSGEKVVYNKKELTKTTKVNGTGKTLNLYVTYGEKDENYTGKFTVKVYGKKTNKLYKTLVEKVTVKVPEKEEPQPEEPQPEEPVAELPTITSVKATKVDTLEVTFASAVTAEDVEITVARGTADVTVASKEWNADKTVLTVVTDTKMVNGKHVVTAKSATLGKEVTGEVTIESQKVTSIVIKNKVALTNANKEEAYVYYDVLDQYGESIKSTTSINWTTSTNGTTGKDTNAGRLTLRKKDGNGNDDTFTYNEQIYITGVYEKTGVTISEVVSVGMEQSLDTITLAGFVKKNTTKLLTSLPANFKSGEYFLAYSVLDQNGNELDPSAAVVGTNVTFISENVLVVAQNFTSGNTITIDGTEYATVTIEPGDKVSDGGEVSIKAIATKTGTTTTLVAPVGEDVKLASFTMSEPSTVVADGETVEIPFVALDQNGNEIKSFANIAKAKTYNELSFSTSGTVSLMSDDSGVAHLYFTAPAGGTMDGVDVPVVINTIVTMGTGSTLTLSVADKAVPVGINGISQQFKNGSMYDNLDTVIAETGEFKFDATSLKYVDQYGRKMLNWVGENNANTTGFFGNAFASGTTDYNGYTFYVKAEYVGAGKLQYTNKAGAPVAALTKGDYFLLEDDDSKLYNSNNDLIAAWDGSDDDCVLKSDDDITSVATGETFKFSIVKVKNTSMEGVSTNKNIEFKIVDTSKLTGLALNPYYETVKLSTANSAKAVYDGTDANAGATVAGANGYEVGGYYEDAYVVVPADQVTVSGKFLYDNTNSGRLAASGSAIKWSDLYDFTSAKNVRKTASDRLVATITNVVATGSAWSTTAAATVKISDGASTATTIKVGGDGIVNANDTDAALAAIIADDSATGSRKSSAYTYYLTNWFVVFDQYGLAMTTGYNVDYTLKNIAENAEGRTDDNFKVTGNGGSTPSVTGAELGDKFDLEISVYTAATKTTVTETVSLTVGADDLATVTGNGNNYHALLTTLNAQ